MEPRVGLCAPCGACLRFSPSSLKEHREERARRKRQRPVGVVAVAAAVPSGRARAQLVCTSLRFKDRMLARLPSPRPRGVRWHVTGSSHGPGVPGDTQRLSLSQHLEGSPELGRRTVTHRRSLTVLPQVPGPVGGPVSVLRPQGQGTVSFWTSRRAGIVWVRWCLSARHAHIWYVLPPEAGGLPGVFPRGCGCEQSPIAGSLTPQDLSSPCPHPRHPCILSRRPGHASRPHAPSEAELSARPVGWDGRAVGPRRTHALAG